MNERLMRIAPRSFAEFLYAFEEDNGKQPDLLWLVWRYEGDYTLFDLLQVPNHVSIYQLVISPCSALQLSMWAPTERLFQTQCPMYHGAH